MVLVARALPSTETSLIWLLPRLKKPTELVSSVTTQQWHKKTLNAHLSSVSVVLVASATASADTSPIGLYERLYTISQSLTENHNRTSNALQFGHRGIVLTQARESAVHGRHRAKLGTSINKSLAQTVAMLITLNSGGTTMSLLKAKADEKKPLARQLFFFPPVPTVIGTNLQRRRGVESSISRKARKSCCAWSTAVFVCASLCACVWLPHAAPFSSGSLLFTQRTRAPACDGT